MFTMQMREYLMALPGVTEEFDGHYKKLSAFLAVAHDDDGNIIQIPTEVLLRNPETRRALEALVRDVVRAELAERG